MKNYLVFVLGLALPVFGTGCPKKDPVATQPWVEKQFANLQTEVAKELATKVDAKALTDGTLEAKFKSVAAKEITADSAVVKGTITLGKINTGSGDPFVPGPPPAPFDKKEFAMEVAKALDVKLAAEKAGLLAELKAKEEAKAAAEAKAKAEAEAAKAKEEDALAAKVAKEAELIAKAKAEAEVAKAAAELARAKKPSVSKAIADLGEAIGDIARREEEAKKREEEARKEREDVAAGLEKILNRLRPPRKMPPAKNGGFPESKASPQKNERPLALAMAPPAVVVVPVAIQWPPIYWYRYHYYWYW